MHKPESACTPPDGLRDLTLDPRFVLGVIRYDDDNPSTELLPFLGWATHTWRGGDFGGSRPLYRSAVVPVFLLNDVDVLTVEDLQRDAGAGIRVSLVRLVRAGETVDADGDPVPPPAGGAGV